MARRTAVIFFAVLLLSGLAKAQAFAGTGFGACIITADPPERGLGVIKSSGNIHCKGSPPVRTTLRICLQEAVKQEGRKYPWRDVECTSVAQPWKTLGASVEARQPVEGMHLYRTIAQATAYYSLTGPSKDTVISNTRAWTFPRG